jgi:carboxypeptidase C (cathepsin A)
MLQENGPFVIPPEKKAHVINPFAWNKRAGLVYFEAPAGVGYSLSNNDEILND